MTYVSISDKYFGRLTQPSLDARLHSNIGGNTCVVSYFASAAMFVAGFAFSPASAKTVKECDAEYSANKAAIKGTQKKADFIAACRAGSETIPGAPPAAAAPAPASTVTTVAPAPAPASPSARMQPRSPAVGTAASAGANQFASAPQAAARCPGQTVVWVNTKSGVYHFAGSKNYGSTKSGAYMCEADATAAGDRASKKEKHP